MFKTIVAAMLLLFSTIVFSQQSTLPKELEDAVRAKCANGCAVISAEEMAQLEATVAAIAQEAFEKGRKSEKGSCRKLGNET